MQEQLKANLKKILDSAARYDPSSLDVLENALLNQVELNWYDADAIGAMLRLYQATPTSGKPQFVTYALLKSMMQLPDNDFVLALIIIPDRAKTEKSQILVEMWDLLQAARFEDFWALFNKNLEFAIPGFEKSIRRFILGTVSLTFKEISEKSLMAYMGVSSPKELEEFELASKDGVVSFSLSVPRSTATDFQLSQLTELILSIENKNSMPLGAVSKGAYDAMAKIQQARNEAGLL